MNHHDTQITNYLLHSPNVRDQYVAKIFNVDFRHVSRLRHKCGAHMPRKAAALQRNVKAADLDDMILTAVYRRNLVDMVLDG